MMCDKDHILIFALCLFIAFLSFKPSEPYLSQFLICNFKTEEIKCNSYNDSKNKCNSISNSKASSCLWTENDSYNTCAIKPCSDYTIDECGSVNYCIFNEQLRVCKSLPCYKNFSENEVNNEIYPWSTYAYLIFLVLLLMGPMSKLVSFRIAIIVGVLGRVATRFLLLYGKSILEMQIMQMTYALGTAAEDLFTAYVYSIVPLVLYQETTSYIKVSAMLASVCASILGDILVTQYHTSIWILMIISATSVTLGAILGAFLLTENRTEKMSNIDTAIRNGSNSEELQVDIDEVTETITTNKQPSKLKTMHKKFIHIQSLYGLFHSKCGNVLRQIHIITSVIHKSSNLIKLFFGWWVVGSSVYMILIGYEISIYAEYTNGSDMWNGSILAIMQICGCIGAMMPVWLDFKLDQDNHINTNKFSADTNSVLSNQFIIYVSIAGVVSVLSIVIYVLFWTLYVSIPALTVFFMVWQFINVIFLAKLASYFKEQNSTNNDSYEPIMLSDPLPIPHERPFHNKDNNYESDDQEQYNNHTVSPSSDISHAESNDNGTGNDTENNHSIAVMFALITSAFLQVILQIILFSWLNLSLYLVSVILCILYSISVFVYLVYAALSIIPNSSSEPLNG